MRLESVVASAAGERVQSPQAAWTFIPASLPPAIEYTLRLVTARAGSNTFCWAWKLPPVWRPSRDGTERFAGLAGAIKLIDALLVNPMMDAKRAALVMSRSDPSARQAIAALETAGILREITGRNWGKVYSAHEALTLPLKPDHDLRQPLMANA